MVLPTLKILAFLGISRLALWSNGFPLERSSLRTRPIWLGGGRAERQQGSVWRCAKLSTTIYFCLYGQPLQVCLQDYVRVTVIRHGSYMRSTFGSDGCVCVCRRPGRFRPCTSRLGVCRYHQTVDCCKNGQMKKTRCAALSSRHFVTLFPAISQDPELAGIICSRCLQF